MQQFSMHNISRTMWALFFVVLTAVSTTTGLFLAPKKAAAQWDPFSQFAIDLLEQQTWPTITDVIKAQVIKFAHKDLVDWISGKNGKPLFITDFDEWIIGQADDAVSTYLYAVAEDGYTRLCSGIDSTLALYLLPQYDDNNKFKTPPCNLSDIQLKYQQQGNEWSDFSLALEGANTDSGYLFSVIDNVQQQKEDQERINSVMAIAGQGYADVEKKKDDKSGKEKKEVKTPGKTISDYLASSIQSNFDVPTSSTSWFAEVTAALLDGAIEGGLKRGLNEFNKFKNK